MRKLGKLFSKKTKVAVATNSKGLIPKRENNKYFNNMKIAGYIFQYKIGCPFIYLLSGRQN
jgi:hypothetical protein